MKRFLIIICLLLPIFQVKAQNHINTFLTDLSIKDFKLNSTLVDIQKNKRINSGLTFFAKEDNVSMYILKDQKINLFDLGTTEAFLNFENGKLKKMSFEVLGDLDDGIFERMHKLFESKYGKPVSLPTKNNLYKIHVWKEGDNELILKPLKISFMIIFKQEEPANKNKYWIYKSRKGKGENLVQLNLNSWGELVNSKLTINEFEKYLPEWESTGTHNHIQFGFNEKTKKMDVPEFLIDYKLNNYNIEITTADTVSKIIADYKFFNIKNPFLINNIENSLIASNYRLDRKNDISGATFYRNDLKKTTVVIFQDDNEISFKIYK